MAQREKIKHRLPFRTKIIIYTVTVLFVVTVVTVYLIARYERSEAYNELIRKAKTVSKALSLQITEKVLIEDYVGIEKAFEAIMKADRSVYYIFLEKEGHVMVHTFEGGFPEQLLDPLKRGPEGEALFVSGGERYMDFVAPVWGGRAGNLHMGFELEYIEQEVLNTTKRVITAGAMVFLIFSGLSYLVSGWLARPLVSLTLIADAYTRGDYTPEVSYSGDDEVGRLCEAFTRMRNAISQREALLKEKNRDLEEANQKLKEYIEEINRTRDELIKLKQDTTVQETVSAVLHHLRQPLTVVLGYIEMFEDEMASEDADPQRLIEMTKKITLAGNKLSEILKKIEGVKRYKVVRYGDEIKIIDID